MESRGGWGRGRTKGHHLWSDWESAFWHSDGAGVCFLVKSLDSLRFNVCTLNLSSGASNCTLTMIVQ